MKIVEYFTLLTGLKPTKDQENVLLDIVNPDIHKIIVSAGCQSGKTLCSAVGALWWAFESGERVNILLISAQDSILYYHIREIFKKHDELSDQLTSPFSPNLIPLKGFELTNSNQVFVRGSTEKQLSGIPANIVILDETCLIKRDIILEAFNRLTQPVAKFVSLSTPSDPKSLFVEWTGKDSRFKVHQWSSEGLAWHDPEIDATKKKEFTPAKYAVYMLGRPPSKAERTLFLRSHLDKCWYDHLTLEGGSNSRIEIGIDWGFDPCSTVLTLREKLSSRARVILQKVWHKKPIEDYAPELVDILEKFPLSIVKADSRPVEYKAYMDKNYPKIKINYLDGIQHKDQELEQLGRHIRQHTLELSNMDLFKQLCLYKRGMRTGDRVDSLALACYEPTVPFFSKPLGTVLIFKKKK